MAGPPQEELFTDASVPDGTVAVNGKCLVRTQDGHRVVLVAGIVLSHYAVSDRMAEAHVMLSLVEQGWAEQGDIARAFGCSSRTVRRFQRRFELGGLPALARPPGYPGGRPRLPRMRARTVSRLKAEGHSNREIARRLGVSEKAIKIGEATVRRWKRLRREKGSLEPKKFGGGNPPRVSAEQYPVVRAILDEKPDLTDQEVAWEFHRRTGRPVSRSSMNRLLLKLALTRKKRPSSP